jgi:tetratricopeptide (TPR) repeat protein
MLGDTAPATRNATEAMQLLTPLGDSWGLVHVGALLGGIAQAEHRFDDAVDALARAAHESQRLGFLGQAALHLASLARVQQRAGAVEEATASFDRALAAARTSGDGRLASTARLNLARLRRAAGDHRAAVDLLEENERWYDDQVHALDAMACTAAAAGDRRRAQELLDAAESLAPGVVHLVDAHDRLDRARARELLADPADRL